MAFRPLIIGLTGGIASGKTTVSDLFVKKGIPVIDADVIAHRLVQPGQPTLAILKEAFGTSIFYDDGTLNRAKLRQQVFKHLSQRKQLEAILHPKVMQTMWVEVAQVKTPYCIFSIPLLVETQWVNQVDRVLVVDCSVETQRKRLKIRNNFTDTEITEIIVTQATREERLAVAHEVINNDTIDLASQVALLHTQYLLLAQSRSL